MDLTITFKAEVINLVKIFVAMYAVIKLAVRFCNVCDNLNRQTCKRRIAQTFFSIFMIFSFPCRLLIIDNYTK